MKFGPKRAHVMFIFERFINDFGLFIVALIIFLVVRDIQILLDNLFIVAIALFGPISRLIKYFCTRYTIDSEKLMVDSGWLKKEKLEIPLATISSVDLTQNLLFQITNVYALQVENAGSIGNAGDGSVKLILGREDAEFAKKLLLSKKEEIFAVDDAVKNDTEQKTEGSKTLRASAGEVLAMSVFQIKWIVIAVQMLAYLIMITSYADQYVFESEQSSTEMLIDFAFELAPAIIAGMILGTYLFSVVISTFFSFIKYYNFRITDRKDAIHIEYGLFTKKTHTLMKEKISGITYQQSLIMRVMKKGTLQIFVTGYGGVSEDNQQETVLLYPVVEEGKIYPFLNWILPENVRTPEYVKAPNRGLPYFFLCGRFIFSVILGAGMLLAPVSGTMNAICNVLGIAVLLVAAGSVLMEHKTSAAATDDSMITLNYGGFRRHIAMLRRDKVEYVEDSASELKRKKRNLSSIKVGVLAPTGMSSHRVRNMDISVFDDIKDKLIY